MATPYQTVQGGSSLQPQIERMYSAARAQFAPGGGFDAGVRAQLSRVGRQALSAGMQNLVSAGLAGTTQAGQLGHQFAEEVAAPTMAQVETERAHGIAGVYGQQAGAYQQLEQMRQQAYQQAAAQANQYNIAMRQLGFQREQAGAQQQMAQQQQAAQLREQQLSDWQQQQMQPQAAHIQQVAAQQPGAAPTVQDPAGFAPQQPAAGPSTITVNGQQFVLGADGLVRRM